MGYRKQRYDLALNGQGLILANRPELPRLIAQQDEVFQVRYAQGDRDYYDFVKWWYWAQTDWSGGNKDEISWKDDAKSYFSTNIDTFSELGAFKLSSGLALENDFSEEIYCGSFETVGTASYGYVGTKDDATSKPRVYQNVSGVWSSIAGAWMPTTADWVSDILGHGTKLWVLTVGSAAATTYVVTKCDADGANPIDYTANIATAMGWGAVTGAMAAESDGNTLYLAVQQYTNNKYGIVKTANNGTTWTKLVEFASENIISCLLLAGDYLYYLVEKDNGYEFRSYKISTSVDVSIQFFPVTFSTVAAGAAASRRQLKSYQGFVVLTLGDKEIWQYDPSDGSLTRLLKRDAFKQSLSNFLGEASFTLTNPNSHEYKGAIFHDYKLWWGNLIYDGSHFFNSKKDFGDVVTNFFLPLYSDGSLIYGVGTSDLSKLYKDSGYKGTENKNYLVFNNFDKVSGVDKLAYSLTLLFKKLASGQKIVIEYYTGELYDDASFITSWTNLGTLDFSVDGGTITQKTFYFGNAVIFRKLWLRIKLEGNGTTTPTVTDSILAYLPMPDYKLKWQFTVKCVDEQLRKDQTKEPKTALELRNFLQQSWLTKSILSFEDYDASVEDYVSGSLNGTATTITIKNSTDGFPEVGRLLIDTEEIFYTGKTKTTFTGCTREVRGTIATTHSDNATVSMAHRVIITNYSEQLILANEAGKAEYQITLQLSEV